MLLIVASDNDPNSRRIIDQAHMHGIDYHLLDVGNDPIPTFHWRMDHKRLVINEMELEPDAIYVRHDVFTKDRQHWSSLATQSLVDYAEIHPSIHILNRGHLGHINNKIVNLKLAKDLGLRIPQTTVVTGQDIPEALQMQLKLSIFKPLQGGDYVKMSSDFKQHLHSSLLQTQLKGVNYRVFVIGDRDFTFKITTNALDYRLDQSPSLHFVNAPDKIRTACGQIAKTLGLDYCAHDFRSDEDGQWHYLETNSFPMFVAFDDVADNALAAAQLHVLGYSHR